MRCPVLLERAEVVGVPEFAAQLLEDGPVPLAPNRARPSASRWRLQIGDDSVVVEQGVVDVEQEDNRVFHAAQITSHELLPCRRDAQPESARGMWPWSRHGPARTGCDTVILNEDDSAWVGSADRSEGTDARSARFRVRPVETSIRRAAAVQRAPPAVPNRRRGANQRGGLRRRRRMRSGVPGAAPRGLERTGSRTRRSRSDCNSRDQSFASRPLTSTPTGIATSSRRLQTPGSTSSSISGADGSASFTRRRFASGSPAPAWAPPRRLPNPTTPPTRRRVPPALRPAAVWGPSPAVPVRRESLQTFAARPVSRGIDPRGPPSLLS